MNHIARITPEYFNETKRFVRWHTIKRTADRFGISRKTALQVRGSNTYHQYQENVRAQHPPTKYSLGEDVLELHRLTFDKKDNKYLTPPSARKAMIDLLNT